MYRARLGDDEIGEDEGIAVTTAARSIVDAASIGTGPEQVARAVREAMGRALASPGQRRAAAARPRYRNRRTVLPLIERSVHNAAR